MSASLVPAIRRWPSAMVGFLTAAALLVFASRMVTAAVSAAPPPTNPSAAAKVDFNHHIRPLLSDRCFVCHGPDEKGRKGKLRLDTQEGLFKSLEDGLAVVKPGEPSRSELLRRITTRVADDLMPPPESHLALNAAEIDLFRRWIEQGAAWKKHWAFLPVGAVEVPAVRNRKAVRNEVDRFVVSRLEREGLTPSPEARREHLLRRLTLDLTGLPPTVGEMEGFLADRSPTAYERAVDRLLASPAFGERLAVEWLDVSRYADTHGYQSDRENAMWPWRDWVISAFNRNVRINQFILWQIAGDLLPGATREQRLATAFNRNHRQTNEGGSVNEEFRVEYVADRLHTLSGAFLGLTMECARCHDHKFDPISQKDYFRLFAFFNSTEESGLYSHFTDATPSPALLLFKDDAQERQHAALRDAVGQWEAKAAARREAVRPSVDPWLSMLREPLRVAGLIGSYSFDTVTNSRVLNQAGTNHPARLNDAPAHVPGRFGSALEFTGENSVTIEKLADFKRTDPFSFGLWLNVPEELEEIVVMHHQQAGSDAGYNGYQLVLENGRATFGLIHFWPGNAIKVRTKARIPLHEWIHVGITYDGSSRAAGLKIFLNGEVAELETVRDHLYKDSANGAPLTLGARFRGRGFKQGRVDELKVFNRTLTEWEMAAVAAQRQEFIPAHPLVGDRERQRALEYYVARADAPSAEWAESLRQARLRENEFIAKVPEIMSMGDTPKPRPTHVLKRGAYDAPGEEVTPDTPVSILAMDARWPRNRLGLAQWLVDDRHPLTARVLVNRYWQLFFGRGLVVTPENFGFQGSLPSHPELLDWLAGRFVESGWDLKALCRLLVTSATYRQSSLASTKLLARDPDNVLLARGPMTRLTAEMLRDQALATSGLLVNRVGGPSVKPYQPEGVWEETAGASYRADKGDGLYRRSLYTFWKRTAPPPSMITFDAAERNNCTVRRQSTSTPLQALVLLNDPQFVEAARRMGERALKEGGATPALRVTFLFRLLTSRAPSRRELAILRELHHEQLALFRAQPGQAKALLAGAGESAVDPALDPSEVAAAAAVALAVMNFDEAVFKR